MYTSERFVMFQKGSGNEKLAESLLFKKQLPYGMPSSFTVNLNQAEYLIEPARSDEDCVRFKVFAGAKYLFTLCMTAEGGWDVESDVRVFDETLIENLGTAIEDYYIEGTTD